MRTKEFLPLQSGIIVISFVLDEWTHIFLCEKFKEKLWDCTLV